MYKKQRGMTLIELMIVIAIVAILASIAIPAYGRYVMRANRVDATAALLRLAAAQERFYLQNNTYGTAAAVGVPATENGFYALAVTANDATGFTATATAQGRQLDDDDCQVFSINQLGQRTSTDGGGADTSATCWRR
jgi:type IV pilus assembly protein PilE